MMSDLPQGWVRVPITDIAAPDKFAIVDGPFGSDLKLSDYVEDGTVPVLTTKNLASIFDPTGVRHISLAKYEQLKRSKVEPGDILIAKIGSVGKCSIYPLGAPTAIIPANLCKITVDPQVIDNKFLFFQITSDVFQRQLKEIVTATAQPAFSVRSLKSLTALLPPVFEQRRIVAKLEQVLARVDACRSQLAQVPTLLKRYRQSVLAAACSGRLTEDWREEHCITEAYGLVTIDKIADYIGGYAYKSSIFTEFGKHQVVRIGNVKPFTVDTFTSPVYINDEIANDTERFKLLLDDIVISQTGTKYKRDYGYAALVRQEDGDLYLNQRVSRIRCRSDVIPLFLLYWLQTDEFRNQYFAGETGNVNQGNVGADGIRKAEIQLPSLEEQQEIVRRVTALLALADQVETRYAQAKTHVDRLTQSILAKAFRGELVAQDPADEPATVLLARIQAERGTIVSRKRGGK